MMLQSYSLTGLTVFTLSKVKTLSKIGLMHHSSVDATRANEATGSF